jgi:CRP-like cAMP-binding protein
MKRVKARAKGISGRLRAGIAAQRENVLLAAMPEPDRRRLTAAGESVELRFGAVLCRQGGRIRHVYFPTGGIISLVAHLDGRPGLEVGLVGAEGVVGIPVVLGVNIAPVTAVVQGAGSALRIEARRFCAELDRSPALRAAISRYLYVLVSFHLTQEFMAYMLGVRRAGVTRAANVLRARRFVSYSRGNINILDVRGLEGASCSCYATARGTYARFMRRGHTAQRSILLKA